MQGSYFKFFISILSLFFVFNSSHANIPKESCVPGGVALVPLMAGKHQSKPIVDLKGQPVAVIPNPDKASAHDWLAVVGIPLLDTPKTLWLKVDNQILNYEKPIPIEAKNYPTEKLKFKVGTQKGPSPELVARLEKETAEMENAFESWHPKEVATFKLKRPVKVGRISGLYGARRMINGEMKRPHRGLDFAAPIGTPVLAAATGKVILVANHLLTGKTVMLDHGQGFKTVYCHLHNVKVKQGAQLKAGQALGTVGKTGRATGPHLHFGVSLNNERVSPELFL